MRMLNELEITEDIVVGDGEQLCLRNCVSGFVGDQGPIIDVGRNSQVLIKGWYGKLCLRNVREGSVVSVDVEAGHVVLVPDGTCTGGIVNLRGMYTIDNPGTGTVVSAN